MTLMLKNSWKMIYLAQNLDFLLTGLPIQQMDNAFIKKLI